VNGHDWVAVIFAATLAVALDAVVIGFVSRDQIAAGAGAALAAAIALALLTWWKGATP
jgi:hypothetical protein